MVFKEEFKKRVAEIDSFYEILRVIELENPSVSGYNLASEKRESLPISSSRIDILRSTAYLLLYNVIESTVYNAVIAVFDQISDKGLKYFDVIEELQKYWLNNLYKHDDKKRKDTIVDTIMDVAIKIFNNTITLASSEINYGGSLDAKAIFATAKSMKINIDKMHKVYNASTHGQILIEIKQKRNWLAHGEKSFIDVGSSSSLIQLKEAKEYVLEFLNEFIVSVGDYIVNSHYRATTAKL